MRLSIITCCFLIVAGCAGSSGKVGETNDATNDTTTDATADGSVRSEPTMGEPWTVTASASGFMTSSFGTPYESYQQFGDACATFILQVAENATALGLVVEPAPIPEGGTGALAVLVQRPDEDFVDGPRGDGALEMDVQDPESGSWFVWVWPDGAVLNKKFEVVASVAGSGPAPAQLEFSSDGC